MYSTLLSSFLLIGGPCDTVPPPLNRSILTFVEEHLDQKVGSGECWDLVAVALDKAGREMGRRVRLREACRSLARMRLSW
jgi:hypothetical protein